MTTHVQVSKASRDALKNAKERLGLKSVDDVIVHLLGYLRDDSDLRRDDSAQRKRSRAGEEDVEEKKVPQLISYDVLTREAKAVKWFTGLKQEAFDWVVRELQTAVRICRIFSCFASFQQTSGFHRGAVGA